MQLYDYYRSSACYRVRIVLALKQIPYEKMNVHLVNHGGEQNSPRYQQINPQKLVPSLEINGLIISQSLAIIDYLDETHPTPALLPQNALERALTRSLALIIACDIHPLNNLRVLNQLKEQFQAPEEAIQQWYHQWLKSGFDAFEAKLNALERSRPLCFGKDVSLADVCLIPQVYNANRFGFNMEAYPLINEINQYCLTLDAFRQTAPELVG